MIATCSQCGGQNRIPAARVLDKAKCGQCKAALLPLHTPVSLHDAKDFDELVKNAPGPVIVDFWAAWCGPCRQVAPELEKLAKGRAGTLVVAKVDTEELPEIAARHQIRSIPTFILFEGGREVKRAMGAMPAERLTAELRI